MTFQEAYELLQQGKYLTRDFWNVTGEYCILLPGMPYIWKILMIPNPSAGNWLGTIEDMNATDWKIVEKKEAEEPKEIPVIGESEGVPLN